jgi:glycosyltransferase involved in cell wall biosynthesis
MRIAHFVSAFPVRSETFVYDEIEAFARSGFENIIVSLRPPPKGVRSESDEKNLLGNRTHSDLGIVDVLDTTLSPLSGLGAFVRRPVIFARVKTSIVAAAFGAPTEAFQLFWTLQRACESVPKLAELDVVHCHAHFAHYPASLAWACARLLRVPFSYNAHGYDLYRYRSHLKTKLRDAKRIFPISDKNRDFFFEKGGSGGDLSRRLVVSRCGVDLEDYPFQPRSGKFPDEPLLVAVGRLVDIKGFSDLIEAARLLAAGEKNVRVEIVGEGPDRAALERQIGKARLGERVRLLGSLSREATRDVQARADLVAQPSRPGKHGPEGIPIVLMEAMALGVPVLSTRFAAIPELVEDGVTGFLAPPADPRALAQSISQILTDGVPPQTLAQARARIEHNYNGPANYYKKAQTLLIDLGG